MLVCLITVHHTLVINTGHSCNIWYLLLFWPFFVVVVVVFMDRPTYLNFTQINLNISGTYFCI